MISPYILDHAKSFDDSYIKPKSQNIYCPNETVIISYLIVKSVSTPRLRTIVMNGYESKLTLPFPVSMHRTVIDVGFYDKLSKFNKIGGHLKFKNKSKIYFYDSRDILKLSSDSVDLVYIRNNSITSLMFNSSPILDTLCMSLKSHGRLIYNFTK